MISSRLVLYCFLASGIYLLLMSMLLALIGRALRVTAGIPQEIREPVTSGWSTIAFIMEYLFYAVLPTFAYSFFYVVFPLTSVRVGMGGALLAFSLGALPAVMGLTFRIRLPVVYLLFHLVGHLLKLAGSLIIIGYLHSL